MNHWKKYAIAFGGAFLATSCIIQPAPVYAATFADLGDSQYLYMNGQSINLNAEGERVTFVLKDRILRMYSRDGKHDYMSFLPYAGEPHAYYIQKIEMKNPSKVFFEIRATYGPHDYSTGSWGYWIIGKYKGQWTTFISLDTLRSNGYDAGQQQMIRVSNTEDPTALMITSSHFNPKRHIDMRLVLHWDDRANWFSTSRIM